MKSDFNARAEQKFLNCLQTAIRVIGMQKMFYLFSFSAAIRECSPSTKTDNLNMRCSAVQIFSSKFIKSAENSFFAIGQSPRGVENLF